MSRVEELERDRQIADIQAIFARSRAADERGAETETPLDEGTCEELTGFGDGFDPPRGALRARIVRHGRSGVVFAVVAVLTAAVTALVTWLLRPAATAVPSGGQDIAAVDEKSEPTSGATAESPSASASGAPAGQASGDIVVAVVGQVANPGLVTLPEGSRVSDAIAAAGGVLPGTDLTTINIARKLSDGEQIAVGVPAPSDAGTGGPSAGDQAAGGPSAPVNINTAGIAELDTLPGIGPVLAQAIVDFRQENGPFASVDELTNVSGVGPAIVAKIKDRVTV